MEPITLITTALAFGATEAGKAMLGEAGKAAYSRLKDLIRGRFAGDEEAEHALTYHEKRPEAYAQPLILALQAAQADQDAQILEQAQKLLAAGDPAGTAQGKYNVTISGGQGISTGDGLQINHFGTSSTP